MAAFEWEEVKQDWRTYDLFRFGPVTLFHNSDLLNDAILHLRNHNYLVSEIDCRTADNEPDFYNCILFALGSITATYKNIIRIQFWDLVTDAKFGDEKGVVLSFRHFDAFYRKFPDCAADVLDILAEYQYRWLWFGKKITTLVQTDDPTFELKTIRELKARWNGKESVLSKRISS